MPKIRLPGYVLLNILPLDQLKGAIVEDRQGVRFLIDSIYQDVVDLVEEKYGTKGIRPYKRVRFDERFFVTIEIDNEKYAQHKPYLDELNVRELALQKLRLLHPL